MDTLDLFLFVFGIAGYISSLALIASPLTIIRRIWTRGDVEGFLPYQYLATLLNFMLWVFYTPNVHPSSIVVVMISAIGLIVELAYVIVFLYFGNNELKIKICIGLVIEFVTFIVVVALTIGSFDTHADRMRFVGICRIISGIVMYVSPVFVVLDAINTRSVEFMPYEVILFYTVHGIFWIICGTLESDQFILIPSAVGMFLGFVQVVVYMICPAPTAEDMALPPAAPEIFDPPDAAINPLGIVPLNLQPVFLHH